MNKIEKLLRDAKSSSVFADNLMTAFKVKFRRNLTAEYSIMAMALISAPSNGKPYTPKQRAWVEGFDAGYREALDCLKKNAG